MKTIDLRKNLKPFYSPSARKAQIIEPPPLQTIAIDGKGDPNTSPEFHTAINALYALAYTAKFTLKHQGKFDFSVMYLEALWWMSDKSDFDQNRKDDWCWKLYIVVPDFFDTTVLDTFNSKILLESYKGEVLKKKPELEETLSQVRIERFDEGKAAQIMHLGPYSEEKVTIEKLLAFISEQGYKSHGKHHEVYIGDPRRSDPAKLKTILRHPVTK